MRTLVIGDIHGCYEELQSLLDEADLLAGDRIIALGDIVDRGPGSPQVLEFFRHQANAQTLLGNHERKHVKAWLRAARPALSQKITRRQIGEASYPAAVDFLSLLPEFIELPEAILVHGMFEPGIPLAEQRSEVIVGTLSGDGYLARRYDRPWQELYDGGKPLIVGHHDYSGRGEPLVRADGKVFGIDTACCHGRALTGIVLPEFRLISVPSRADYWTRLQAEHADLRYETTPIEDLTWEAAEALLAQSDGASSVSGDDGRAVAIRELLTQADEALDHLFLQIIGTNDQVLADLRQQTGFDMLSLEEQGRRYAERIGRTPLASFLHQARKGKVSRATLRAHFTRPQQLLRFLRRHAILDLSGRAVDSRPTAEDREPRHDIERDGL